MLYCVKYNNLWNLAAISWVTVLVFFCVCVPDAMTKNKFLTSNFSCKTHFL